MKRIFSFLLTLALIFCLAGCSPSGYLDSTDGELIITLPEPEPEKPIELNETGKALIGEWELVSLTYNGTPVEFDFGTYVFSEYGYLDMNIAGTNLSGKVSFSCQGNDIYIGENRVSVSINEDIATITSNSNIHVLKKVVTEEEPETTVPAE